MITRIIRPLSMLTRVIEHSSPKNIALPRMSHRSEINLLSLYILCQSLVMRMGGICEGVGYRREGGAEKVDGGVRHC